MVKLIQTFFDLRTYWSYVGKDRFLFRYVYESMVVIYYPGHATRILENLLIEFPAV